MTPIRHYKTNNNMTIYSDTETDYGHFYDIEKNVYLDNYKHLEKNVYLDNKHLEKKSIKPLQQSIPSKNKIKYLYNVTTISSYILVSVLAISATIYYFI